MIILMLVLLPLHSWGDWSLPSPFTKCPWATLAEFPPALSIMSSY